MNIDAPFAPQRTPYLTADLPGTGGEIKRYDEDFFVEELPLYEPSGAGTHLYIAIEKKGVTTDNAIAALARALDKRRSDFGYAGRKDSRGITRQTLSIEHVEPERIEALDLPAVKILTVTRHTNKLKLGHLAGNRFVICVRDVAPSALALAQPIIDAMVRRGLPNYFGRQRFGVRMNNAAIGRAVLLNRYDEAIALLLGGADPTEQSPDAEARRLFDSGDSRASAGAWPHGCANESKVCKALVASGGDARTAWRAVDHGLRKLFVSALQSELFNRVLTGRIDAIDRLERGDVAWKHVNGACFSVEDAGVEQPRCDAFEISPTGPLFGKKMKQPSGAVVLREAAVLHDAGFEDGDIRCRDGTKLDGARRPLRVPLGDATVEDGTDERGHYLRLSFTLPPGAYATGVTREVCKTEATM